MSICSPRVFLCPRLLRAAILPLKRFCGIKMQVRGSEHLNIKEPYVIVCNHQASLDLMSTCKGEGGAHHCMGSLWGAAGVDQAHPGGSQRGKHQDLYRAVWGRPEGLVGQELMAMDLLQREGWDNGR